MRASLPDDPEELLRTVPFDSTIALPHQDATLDGEDPAPAPPSGAGAPAPRAGAPARPGGGVFDSMAGGSSFAPAPPDAAAGAPVAPPPAPFVPFVDRPTAGGFGSAPIPQLGKDFVVAPSLGGPGPRRPSSSSGDGGSVTSAFNPKLSSTPEDELRTLPFGTVLAPGILGRLDEDVQPTLTISTEDRGPVPERFAPGEVLHAFALDGPLSDDPGGLGARWLAHHAEHGTCQILVFGAALGEWTKRLLLRYRLLQDLEHNPLVEVPLDFGLEPSPWVALPYRSTPPLEPLLERGVMDPKRAGEILLDFARALEHVHPSGRYHGDPHPRFFLVPPEGRARMCGWARRAVIDQHGQRLASPHGPVLGDTLYLAPEILEGKRPTDRTNSYALGAVLYRMLMGTPHFSGTPEEIATHTLETRVSTPEVLPETSETVLGKRLLSLAVRMLSKEPQLRPAPRELVVQLEAALEGRELASAAPSEPPIWPIALLLFAALLALVLGLVWLSVRVLVSFL